MACEDGCFDESIELQTGLTGANGTNGTNGTNGDDGDDGDDGTAVLDVDHDYATMTTSDPGYTGVKTTPIYVNTVNTIDDIIRMEIDIIGDPVADVAYGIKVEFDNEIMFNFDNLIQGGGNNALSLVIDLIVTDTNAEITPYVNYKTKKSFGRSTQSLLEFNTGFNFNSYIAANTAAIVLNSGTKNIITYLKASGGNSVSVTSYKVFKLLRA